MDISGVIGVGIGAMNGTLVIKGLVNKRTAASKKKIPNTLEVFMMIVEETGEIRAF